ncbi:MAG: hypothetical protein KY468_19915 [Armatimonadetes bacterium]|nr:hypothetical protein [Armatimonadota bacterium]
MEAAWLPFIGDFDLGKQCHFTLRTITKADLDQLRHDPRSYLARLGVQELLIEKWMDEGWRTWATWITRDPIVGKRILLLRIDDEGHLLIRYDYI